MAPPLPIRGYNRGVNSELDRLLCQNSAIVMDAKGLASGVDEAQLNWSEPGSEWSAAQCFEHLNITHRLWLPLTEQAVKDGHEQGTLSNGPYAYGFLSRMFLRMVEPPMKMRFKAPGSFRPQALRDWVGRLYERNKPMPTASAVSNSPRS
ncbi:MAG: DinB family protein [bacterium]|nr:DinB family protein [bacterium]